MKHRILVCGLTLSLLLFAPVAGGTPAGDEPGIPEGQSEENKLKNTLRWTTASEVDNFGFDVYRATSKDGPYKLQTPSPIPGTGTSDVPTKYAYVDDTIKPGQAYFYYVESISMDGTRKRFTPIIRAAAKRPADSSDAGGEGDGPNDSDGDE